MAASSACVVVEDNINGVFAGRRAGMTVVGFIACSHCPPGHDEVPAAEGTDFTARSFVELLHWLDQSPLR